MPKILAIDTSSENCSVALFHKDKMNMNCEHAPRNHTQKILPMVKSMLATHDLSLKEIDVIAFGCGPGSFTGIRISAGIAQGLAFGLDCPVYAISNLEALALQNFRASGEKQVFVALDARMDEVYWAGFELALSDTDKTISITNSSGEFVSAPEKIDLSWINGRTDVKGIGSGLAFLDRFPEELQCAIASSNHVFEPTADAIAELALSAYLRGEEGRLSDALPSYVRDTVTWKKLPGR